MKNKYLSNKCMAFLCNIVVALLPILVWDILLLFIVAGMLPATLLDFVDPFIALVLFVSLLLTNPLISAFYGQTFGAIMFDLQIVDHSHQKAKRIQLFLRECLGYGVVLIVLYYFTRFYGIIAYFIINALVIMMDPNGRSLVDFVIHTRTVYAKREDVVRVDKPIEKAVSVAKTAVVEKAPVKEKPVIAKPVFVKPEIVKEVKKPVDIYPIDLHMHSRYSDDGEYTVEELMVRARKNGVEIISITDHNSVKANFEASVLAERVGLDYIPGIEIDCTFEGYEFHLLGYGINYKDERYIQLENFNLKQERKASLIRVNKFEQLSGLRIDVDALLASNNTGIITGEMIAEQCLLNESFNNCELLDPYRAGGSRSDAPFVNFYWDFFSQGKIAYAPMNYPTLKDMVELIKDTGGIPILAHPSKPFKNNPEIIYAMLENGVRGLEVFSSYHSEDEILSYLKIVKDTSCYVTCGSDFHGKTKPNIELGQSHASEKFNKLIAVFINKLVN